MVMREKFPKQNSNDSGSKIRIDKWDLRKLNSFYKTKDSGRTNQQPTDWEKNSSLTPHLIEG